MKAHYVGRLLGIGNYGIPCQIAGSRSLPAIDISSGTRCIDVNGDSNCTALSANHARFWLVEIMAVFLLMAVHVFLFLFLNIAAVVEGLVPSSPLEVLLAPTGFDLPFYSLRILGMDHEPIHT